LPLSADEVAPEPVPGTLVIYAGTGQSDFSGDNGPATKARLNAVAGLAVDALGNLYLAEWNNHRVRKVSPEGIISTVAGVGTALPSVAGAPAIAVALGALTGIAVDAAGNLYIGDSTIMEYGSRDWVLKVYGVGAPGLIGGQPFPEPETMTARPCKFLAGSLGGGGTRTEPNYDRGRPRLPARLGAADAIRWGPPNAPRTLGHDRPHDRWGFRRSCGRLSWGRKGLRWNNVRGHLHRPLGHDAGERAASCCSCSWRCRWWRPGW
jgi:hypothetical protein